MHSEEEQLSFEEELEESISPEELSEIIWKKNIPLYYNTFIGHTLEDSSLTCEFLPEIKKSTENLLIKEKVITATHKENSENNYLEISNVFLPNPEYKNFQPEKFKIVEKQNSYLKSKENAVELEMKIYHPGEVNKALASYESYNVIATKSDDSNIYIFDYTKINFSEDKKSNQQIAILSGHSTEGWGLDWSLYDHKLISGDNNGWICLYDIENQTPEEEGVNEENKKEYFYSPIFQEDFEEKELAINEVKFHWIESQIYGFCEDKFVEIKDLRDFNENNESVKIQITEEEAFSLDFSYCNDNLLLSGCSSGGLKLWDLRNTEQELVVFEKDKDCVLRVEWNPSIPSLFAAGDQAGKTQFFNCAKLGENNGLVFVCPGIGETINDMCWNYNYELGFMSVDSYCNLFIYEMDSSFFVN